MISDGPSQILAHAFGARYELAIPLVAFVLVSAGVIILRYRDQKAQLLKRHCCPGDLFLARQ